MFKNGIKKIAHDLVEANCPGTYNQAVMEFGALYCKPQNPDCSKCIFRNDCFAYNNNMVNKLPVKGNPVKQRKRYFHYLVLKIKKGDGIYTLLNKRLGKDIWENLYDFPMIEIINPERGIKINTKIESFELIINIDTIVKRMVSGSLTISSKIDRNEC